MSNNPCIQWYDSGKEREWRAGQRIRGRGRERTKVWAVMLPKWPQLLSATSSRKQENRSRNDYNFFVFHQNSRQTMKSWKKPIHLGKAKNSPPQIHPHPVVHWPSDIQPEALALEGVLDASWQCLSTIYAAYISLSENLSIAANWYKKTNSSWSFM